MSLVVLCCIVFTYSHRVNVGIHICVLLRNEILLYLFVFVLSLINEGGLEILYQKKHVYDGSGIPYAVLSDSDSDSSYVPTDSDSDSDSDTDSHPEA